jgi:hypothetical protein
MVPHQFQGLRRHKKHRKKSTKERDSSRASPLPFSRYPLPFGQRTILYNFQLFLPSLNARNLPFSSLFFRRLSSFAWLVSIPLSLRNIFEPKPQKEFFFSPMRKTKKSRSEMLCLFHLL